MNQPERDHICCEFDISFTEDEETARKLGWRPFTYEWIYRPNGACDFRTIYCHDEAHFAILLCRWNTFSRSKWLYVARGNNG